MIMEKVIQSVPSPTNVSIGAVECVDEEAPKERTSKYVSQLLGATVYPLQNTIFFYGGIFSQWAECKFHSKILDVDVNCAEQAMMLQKAKLMNDQDSFDAILKTDNPRVQKAIGRQIKNWDAAAWDKVKLEWITQNNVDKFSQNKGWKELLLLTQSAEIVEASPTDRIWGIGFSVDSEHLLERDLWGQNLLGKAIMNARQQIVYDLI